VVHLAVLEDVLVQLLAVLEDAPVVHLAVLEDVLVQLLAVQEDVPVELREYFDRRTGCHQCPPTAAGAAPRVPPTSRTLFNMTFFKRQKRVFRAARGLRLPSQSYGITTL